MVMASGKFCGPDVVHGYLGDAMSGSASSRARTSRGFGFRALPAAHIADITSSTVINFAVLSGVNCLKNRFFFTLSRFTTQDRFDIFQRVVKTAFVAT